MKKIHIKHFAGLALSCLALVGTSTTLVAQTTNVLSTFDADLRTNPWLTNFWGFQQDTPFPTSIEWTNAGTPAGAMLVKLDWAQMPGQWDWQDAKCQVEPWSSNAPPPAEAINLASYDAVEFDLMTVPGSQSNDAGGYGGVQVIVQTWGGWGSNPTNIDVGYHNLGSVQLPAPGTWQHYTVPCSSWPYTLSRLTLGFYLQQNTNHATHVEVLVDNFKFTTAGANPKLEFLSAKPGVNIWTPAGGDIWGRQSIATVTTNASGADFMWPFKGNVEYTFTVADFPSTKAVNPVVDRNFSLRMLLVPVDVADSQADPDWQQPSTVMMELNADTNGIASYIFRWKTNAPGDNGQFYAAASQITITNPTPVGKWKLAFASDTSVTMTAPNGNSTNFVMGVHTNVPDISSAFSGSPSRIYLMVMPSTNLFFGSSAVFSQATVQGPFVTSISNNFATESSFTPNWVSIAGSAVKQVPSNAIRWITWPVPDAGFALQTNHRAFDRSITNYFYIDDGSGTNIIGTNIYVGGWSTNGVPSAELIAERKRLLITTGMFPTQSGLLYRLSKPGF